MTRKKARQRSRDEGSGEKPKTTATIDDDPESLLEDDGKPAGHPGTGRVDAPTAERRLEWVRKAIVGGFGTSDILAAIDKDWGIGRRQAFRYVSRALKDIQSESKRDLQLEKGKAIERNEMIIRKALNPAKGTDVDLRTAVRANQANARLMGLEAPTRHAHGADPDLPNLPAGDFIVLVQEVVE